MTRLIVSALFAAVVFSTCTPAFAGSSEYGNAIREASASGSITPHGVWDSK
ncbi:hypothetical protein [Hyphomicrobium sp. DY-1]|uniref:hypothetical protein n=1 Tax=Hyphomicrobium sp. DY-1 TaxID=3075650 RepID=UPI0039C05368